MPLGTDPIVVVVVVAVVWFAVVLLIGRSRAKRPEEAKPSDASAAEAAPRASSPDVAQEPASAPRPVFAPQPVPSEPASAPQPAGPAANKVDALLAAPPTAPAASVVDDPLGAAPPPEPASVEEAVATARPKPPPASLPPEEEERMRVAPRAHGEVEKAAKVLTPPKPELPRPPSAPPFEKIPSFPSVERPRTPSAPALPKPLPKLSARPSEDLEAAEPAKPSVTAKAAEPAKPSGVTKAAEPLAEARRPSGLTRAAEPAKPSGMTKAAEPLAEARRPSGLTKAAEPAKPSGATKAADPVAEARRPSGLTKAAEPVAEVRRPSGLTKAAEPAAKPAEAPKPVGAVAKYLAPSNPETAELEKSDTRHAAARRLARLSVSEIKLYHEDEVRAGREAKDLWKRLAVDIGLALQTYDKRVDEEVRQRFDYLYDEILRQLAEGDADKLGPEAPKPKPTAKTQAAPPPGLAAQPGLLASPAAAPAPEPAVPAVAAAPAPEPAPAPAAAAATAPEPAKPLAAAATAPAAEAPKPTAAAIAAKYLAPSNPETAELEKSDPRHAAARRLARLSVSEIKLYHEDEVKAGRQTRDLWKRLAVDIGLALQTYEKRIDKEVRDRFDYLYDEILRQLAEGDAEKLGPDAPKPKTAARGEAAPAPPPAEEPAPAATSASAATPAPVAAAALAPTAAPAPDPAHVLAVAPEPAKPAEVPKPTAAAIAAKYLAPSNPATAELEKNDPRHAAARRLARLSVSEIKLYHEDEVKAGRQAKDLWKRLAVDIGLALQTYEKRVDKEVRDRFDYLYDEILRQLAEGEADKLGPEAPKPAK